MNYLNDYALDELAMRVVRAYLKAPSAQETRVDPAVLCRETLGLRVVGATLSKDGNVLGTTSLGEATASIIDEEGDWALFPLDGKTVLVEKALEENPCGTGRYNFTLVHEACHHILGEIYRSPAKTKNRLLVYRSMKSAQVEFEEWQTDRLTAAILMNRPMLTSAMKEAGIEGGINVLECAIGNDTWSAFCRTAEILGVSLSALEIRMEKLGLIKKNYYRAGRPQRSILDIGG